MISLRRGSNSTPCNLMRFPRFIFTFFIVVPFGVLTGLSQPLDTDSLKQALDTYDARFGKQPISLKDTVKIDLLDRLAQEFYEKDPEQALTYARQQLQLSQKLKYTPGIIKSSTFLGALSELKSDYGQAIAYFKQALVMSTKTGNRTAQLDGYFNIGSVYGKQSNYPEALSYTLKGLAIAKQTKDDFGIGGGYNNLGVIYKSIGDNDKALDAYTKAIEVMRRLENFSALAILYNNIAGIQLSQKKLGGVYSSCESGLKAAKKSGNRQAEGDLYHTLADADLAAGSIIRAYSNYEASLEIRSDIGDSYGIAESYVALGNLDFKNNNATEAIGHCLQGLRLAQKTGEKDIMLQAHKQLSDIYATTGEFKAAYEHHSQFKAINDSLFNDRNNKKMVQLQMEYDFKVEKDSLKSAQIRKDLIRTGVVNDQKIIRNFIILIMGLLVIFLVILMWQRNKIANARRQKDLESERNRISRDLHDNLGAQLSTVRMFVSSLKNKENVETKTVDTSINLLDSSINELRGIMEEMKNSVLIEKGYLSATEELINKLDQLAVIDFSLTHHKMEERPSLQIEQHLFRMTQELINNTLKYASATHISIDVIRRDNKLIFMYEDDGLGFDPATSRKGFGLENIETRIHTLGGTVHFDSMPGAGSRTIAEIPWA